MKITTYEMKNTLDEVNRLDTANKKISEFKDTGIEMA